MGDYDPIAATQIRAMFGLLSFGIMISILGRWNKIGEAVKNKSGMKSVTVGSFSARLSEWLCPYLLSNK